MESAISHGVRNYVLCGVAKKRKKRKTEQPSGLRKLERRIAAVEARLTAARDAPADASDRMDERARALAQDAAAVPGAVAFEGVVDLPAGEHVEWQSRESASVLLDGPWDTAAEPLGALGHPVRIELLRYVLCGVSSTAELAALDVVSTTGQLYHHLNHLIAAGWLRHTGRGRYEVPAERVVPLMVVLAAVRP